MRRASGAVSSHSLQRSRSNYSEDGSRNGASRGAKRSSTRSLVICEHVDQGRLFARIFVHRGFEAISLSIIVVNAVWIGVEVDYRDEMPVMLHSVVENLFVLIFLIELLVRILAYFPRVSKFFTDPEARTWNWCDLFLVAAMVLDSWVLKYLVSTGERSLQALSILRLIRLCRVTRLFRMVPELGMMVKGMVAAMRTVTSTCLMAFGIMYIFAILFTQWARGRSDRSSCVLIAEGGHPLQAPCEATHFVEGDCFCVGDYFGSLGASLLMLTQVVLIDNTFEVVRPIFKVDFTYGILIIVFILLMGFTVMNMLIGVICDVISDSNRIEKDKLRRMKLESIVEPLCAEARQVKKEQLTTVGHEHRTRLQKLQINHSLWSSAIDLLDWSDGTASLDDFYEALYCLLRQIDSEDILRLQYQAGNIAESLESLRSKQSEHGEPQKSKLESAETDDTNAPQVVERPFVDSCWSNDEAYVGRVVQRLTNLGARAQELRTYPLGDARLQQARGDGEKCAPLPLAPQASSQDALDMPMSRDVGLLRTHLRLLSAQLHGLRAELKAAETLYGGAVGRSPARTAVATAVGLEGAIAEVMSRIARVRSMLPGEPNELTASPQQTSLPPRDAVNLQERGEAEARQRDAGASAVRSAGSTPQPGPASSTVPVSIERRTGDRYQLTADVGNATSVIPTSHSVPRRQELIPRPQLGTRGDFAPGFRERQSAARERRALQEAELPNGAFYI
eukprot:TRINITY_DN27491_c0_g2_i1.p1 TRINITY_DN27491_c0_g2~~TRINITY_DN27491_c0_g2_i1.p1  ORF type:complete len:734 (-),score=108.22 TRINITY_DN27491_c0_g2_i1:191-2392(-)